VRFEPDARQPAVVRHDPLERPGEMATGRRPLHRTSVRVALAAEELERLVGAFKLA
jgi:hypothetical protein